MECLVRPTRKDDLARLNQLAEFFANVVVLPVPPEVFDRSASLRAAHPPLKTPDALHLATALHHGCSESWTNDRDLAGVPVASALRVF